MTLQNIYIFFFKSYSKAVRDISVQRETR